MTHPKVTEQDLDQAIKDAQYVVLPDGRTTICILTLDNGFTVRGESSCVSKENFDAEIGQKYAFADARRKVWPLLGFRLADKIMAQDDAPEAPTPVFPAATLGELVDYYEVLNGKVEGPLAAFVAHINADSVNLSVLAPNGTANPMAFVVLREKGSPDDLSLPRFAVKR